MAITEKIGDVIDVNTDETGIQFEPCIAALDNGGFVIGWNNFQVGISAQLYDSQGFRSGGEFSVNTTFTNDQSSPDVATLSDGSFMFVWTHEFNANPLDLDVRGRRFQESGAAINATDFSVATSSALDESGPTITATNDGRWLAAWTEDDGSLGFTQRDNAGAVLSGGAATTGGNGAESQPSVAALLDGSYALVYQAGGDIFERRMVAGDAGAAVNPNSGVTHTLPSVAALEDGGYVVAWEEGNAGSKFVELQRYDFLGNKVGLAFTTVNSPGQIDQTTPTVKGLVGGGFIVAWDDFQSGLRAIAYDSDAHQVGSIFQLTPTGLSGSFGDLDIVQKQDGDIVIAWAGGDADGAGIDAQIVRVYNQVVGTSGDDRLMTQLEGGVGRLNPGYQANDSIQGLGGDDVLQGHGGASDILDGGSGSDTATYIDAAAPVTANLLIPAFNNGEAIGDTYISIENLEGSFFGDQLTGNKGANVIDGVDGADVIDGGEGNDIVIGGIGGDDLDGGAGFDTLDYSGSDGAVAINLATNTASGGDAQGDTIANFERVVGSDGADSLVGGSIANSLSGGLGDDALNGGAGDDVLIGGGGNDTITGSTGADRMTGGTGNDSYFVDNAGDVVSEASNGGDDRVISSITTTLAVNVERLLLAGTSGINGTGNTLANSLTGNAAGNFLEGLAGNDTMSGGGGADRLAGGVGADQLTGGAAADRFIFRTVADSTVASAGRDTILDFSRAEGDRVDLSVMDADSAVSGNQAFHFIGTAAFSGDAGELRATQSGANLFVQADVNGDGAADFGLIMKNLGSMIAADFVL